MNMFVAASLLLLGTMGFSLFITAVWFEIIDRGGCSGNCYKERRVCDCKNP